MIEDTTSSHLLPCSGGSAIGVEGSSSHSRRRAGKCEHQRQRIIWMTTGMAPMMFPGSHQFMPPMAVGMDLACMPASHGLNQMARVPSYNGVYCTLLVRLPFEGDGRCSRPASYSASLVVRCTHSQVQFLTKQRSEYNCIDLDVIKEDSFREHSFREH